jgi:ABC-type polysaccharide/polyol phosphate export permease
MLAPLLNMVALTLVFSSLLKTQIQNYPVYFLAGSLFWTFFSQTTTSAASQTLDANEMTKRIYVPRSVFVVSAVAVGLVNLALSVVPLLLLLLVMGFPLHATWFFLPVGVLLLSVFAAGLGFFLFTLASRFSDVREMYQVLVQTWFFLTPIVYHPAIVPPRYRFALWLNPMYYLIQVTRRPIYDGVLPSPALLAATAAISRRPVRLRELKIRNPKHEIRNKFEIQMLKTCGPALVTRFEHLDFGHSDLFRVSDFEFRIWRTR